MEQTLQILSNATGTNTELLNIYDYVAIKERYGLMHRTYISTLLSLNKVSSGVGDIVVQLDVFNEQNEKGKATRQESTSRLNLNSHHEVSQTIMQQNCHAETKNVKCDSGNKTELAKLALSASGITPSSCLPPPPPISGGGASFNLLPQQCTPKSSIKLKSFNWTKISPDKIINKLNIWTIMANDHKYKCVEVIDFKCIEALFSLQATNKEKRNTGVEGKKQKEPKHIHLLDHQRSLMVNIFLRQFKGYNLEDIVQLILNGDSKIMNLEKLKDLTKFFDKDEEIVLLKGFVGDRQHLASEEKFLILMLEVPNFKLRIESMIFKEEFAMNVTYLEPCLNAIIKAGNDLMKNKTLQEILGIIIIIGNFLNSGGYAGNAAGIKISSLTELDEIKANKPHMHLLHLIAMEVERYNPDLLDLSSELSFLEDVSKLNNNQIEQDIRGMELALDTIKKKIYVPTTDEDIKQQMVEFIQKAEEKMDILNKQAEELKSLRITMAEFFCEDVKTFKVDECFEVFYKFCQQFKQALKENEKRQQLELKAKMRQKQKEDELARISLKAQATEAKSPALLPVKRLRPSGGPSENNNTNLEINSKKNEEDLMKFLHTSNHKRFIKNECIPKTRLDKRPDLPKFNFEREREQHSPLLVENDNENLLPNCETICQTERLYDQRKTSIIRKSWKQLMEGYKASQLRDKCLTPDIAPRRKSLRIFIRSNSTVDSKSGQLKKQRSVVKIIKTSLPKTESAFNFSQSEIQANQAATRSGTIENLNEISCNNSLAKSPLHLEILKDKVIPCEIDTNTSPIQSPVEMRQSRISSKTMAKVAKLGHRYSSINEEDLKIAIKKLRTPNLEKPQFAFSPVRELPPRSSLAFSPTLPKSDDWSCNQRSKELSSVDEETRNEKIHENVKDNLDNSQLSLDKWSKLLKPKEIRIKKEQEPETSDTNNIAIVNETESINLPKHEHTNLISKNFNKEIYEIVLPIDDKTKLNETTSRPNFSQRLVNQLQNKLRALSPLRNPKGKTDEISISAYSGDNERLPTDSNKINICSSNKATDTNDENPEEKDYIAIAPYIEVENREAVSLSKKASSKKKSFVSRLQNKLRRTFTAI